MMSRAESATHKQTGHAEIQLGTDSRTSSASMAVETSLRLRKRTARRPGSERVRWSKRAEHSENAALSNRCDGDRSRFAATMKNSSPFRLKAANCRERCMKERNPRRRKPSSKAIELRPKLSGLRDALLDLHKVLVDSERVTYEQTIGTIQSPNQLLQLLINDPWFAWLHPLSLLIVAMDEVLDDSGALTVRLANERLKETRLLLVASEAADGFAGHYFNALQRDPDVIFAHAKAAKFLPKAK